MVGLLFAMLAVGEAESYQLNRSRTILRTSGVARIWCEEGREAANLSLRESRGLRGHLPSPKKEKNPGKYF